MSYLFQKDHSGSSEKHDLERQTRGIGGVMGWDKNWRGGRSTCQVSGSQSWLQHRRLSPSQAREVRSSGSQPWDSKLSERLGITELGDHCPVGETSPGDSELKLLGNPCVSH